jgi:hypothetical protein
VKSKWGTGWNWDAIPANVRASWVAASRVQDNRIKITAALNLYHELRGSPYRHNVDFSKQYLYDKYMKELKGAMSGKVQT